MAVKKPIAKAAQERKLTLKVEPVLKEFDDWYNESIKAVTEKLKELRKNKGNDSAAEIHYTNLVLKEQVKKTKWMA